MEPIEGILDIDPARRELVLPGICSSCLPQIPTQACCLCRKTSGVCIQCSFPKCPTSFHVICALNNKWHLRWTLNGADDLNTVAYCSKHKARADPPTVPPNPGLKKPVKYFLGKPNNCFFSKKQIPVDDGFVERRGRPRKMQPPPYSPPPSPDRVMLPRPIRWFEASFFFCSVFAHFAQLLFSKFTDGRFRFRPERHFSVHALALLLTGPSSLITLKPIWNCSARRMPRCDMQRIFLHF